MITQDKWTWMGHPAHFICANDCKFFMATKVGKYIISTVGEYFPDFRVREIFAKSRNITIEGIGDAYDRDYLNKIGFEDLSLGGWKYETMVFESKRNKESDACCPYIIKHGSNIEQNRYKTANEALKGHYKLCLEFAKKQS